MARSKIKRRQPEFGRGSGIPHPVDVHVGRRIRMRRLLIGINQDTLAKELGLTFQQVQKYEHGYNRVSASRLSDVARVLGVPIPYFFQGVPTPDSSLSDEDRQWQEQVERPDALELLRCYYTIPDEGMRQQFLDLVKAIAGAPA